MKKKQLYIRDKTNGKTWLVTKFSVRVTKRGTDTIFGKTSLSAYIPEEQTMWCTKDLDATPDWELILK